MFRLLGLLYVLPCLVNAMLVNPPHDTWSIYFGWSPKDPEDGEAADPSAPGGARKRKNDQDQAFTRFPEGPYVLPSCLKWSLNMLEPFNSPSTSIALVLVVTSFRRSCPSQHQHG